jgi:hypothetical protein
VGCKSCKVLYCSKKVKSLHSWAGTSVKFDGTENSVANESVAFYKIWRNLGNLTEIHLMSERNRNFLKTRKSAEFAKLSAGRVDNSAE